MTRVTEPVGEPDCGGNRPLDYLSVEAHDAACLTLEAKERWDDLTQDEIAVVRHHAKECGIKKDIVYADRLALLRCIFAHARNRDEWMERALRAEKAVVVL